MSKERLPDFLARVERDYVNCGLMALMGDDDLRRLFETANKYHEMVYALAGERLAEMRK